MDKIKNNDRFTYQQESASFIRNLRQFHANRGTPFYKIPCIQGKPVDLYLLYSKVSSLGGWNKVNSYQLWDEIQHLFHVPKSCANASQALKEIYIRYLNLYEKVHLHGEDPDAQDRYQIEDDELMFTRKRTNTPVSSVPMKYNYKQHQIPGYIRDSLGLSNVSSSEYDKLERSLLSGLPNEVDFAINVVTLLSNEGKHVLQLSKSHQIIELLMAQVGIFTEGPSSYKSLYSEEWRPKTKRNFVKFWFDTVEDFEIKDLIFSTSEKDEKDKLCEEQKTAGKEVLNLGRDLGISDIEGQRVLQVAVILRNLSFEDNNAALLATDVTAFRFLLLCAHNKYASLKQIGLDTLGNLAKQMTLDPIEFQSTQLVIRTIAQCLDSSDKFCIVRGMEILSKLCQVESNEDIVASCLEAKAYSDVANILTVQDIHLIVYALEALYQLSELGEESCNHIADTVNCVDTLIQLVTIEAGSYGPEALQGIKVVEHQVLAPLSPLSPTMRHNQPQIMQPQPQQFHQMQRSTMLPQRPAQLPASQIVPRSTQPSRPLVIDSEAFACNWLKCHYEVQANATLSRVSMYSDFLQSCTRMGHTAILQSPQFLNCVRVVFPNVETVKIDHDNVGSEVVFRGLSRRLVPLPLPTMQQSVQQMPVMQVQPLGGIPTSMSPHSGLLRPLVRDPPPAQSTPQKPTSVLQQQLMAPPQNSPMFQQQRIIATQSPIMSTVSNTTCTPQVPTSRQAPTPPSPSSVQSSQSSIVKSLLANKLTQRSRDGAHSPQSPGAPSPTMGTPPAQHYQRLPQRHPQTSEVQPPFHHQNPGTYTQNQGIAAHRGSPFTCSLPLQAVPAAGYMDTLQQQIDLPPVSPRGRSWSKGNAKSPRSSPSRGNSPRSKGSPRRSTSSRSGSPRSPRTLQLEICSQVERAQDIVLHQSVVQEAKIEKVVNVCATRLVENPAVGDQTPVNLLNHVSANEDLKSSENSYNDLKNKLGANVANNTTNSEENTLDNGTKEETVLKYNGNSSKLDESHGTRLNGLPNGEKENTMSLEEANVLRCNSKPGDIDISSRKEEILKQMIEVAKKERPVLNGLLNHLPNGDADDILEENIKESKSRTSAGKVKGNEKGVPILENGLVERNITESKSEIQNDTSIPCENNVSRQSNNEPMEVVNENTCEKTVPGANVNEVTRDETTMDIVSKETEKGNVNICSQIQKIADKIPTGESVKRQNSSEDSLSKKKKSGCGSSVDSRRSSTSSVASIPQSDYICDWQQCRRSCESAKATLAHFIKTHVTGTEGRCFWGQCDNLVRKKWSLITHVQDHHCTEQALKGAALRRQQMAHAPPSSVPSCAPLPPVYSTDAAVQAIKRIAIKPPYQELLEPKEGPVTKHIRLTSALILRNLARFSAHGRTVIKKHERHLAYIAMSTVESSGAISNCLWEILNNH